MGRKTKGIKAVELATSSRGQWIIGRALRKAYLEMDKVPDNRKERSDMADMKLIGEVLFPIGWELEDVIQKTSNQHEHLHKLLNKNSNEKDQSVHDQPDSDQSI